MTFKVFAQAVHARYEILAKKELFVVDVGDIFDSYLAAFPQGSKAVHRQIKSTGEESFVTNAAANPQQKALEIALDIVKDVIATKQAANAEALAKTHRAEERRKILDALSKKKDDQLSAASIEELEAKLAALD